MKIRALVNFAGVFSMHKGEIRECSDKTILQDLLSCGYVEKVVKNKEKVKSENEG